VVAQIFQWISLEATRAQFSRDKGEIAKHAMELMMENEDLRASEQGRLCEVQINSLRDGVAIKAARTLFDFFLTLWREFKNFLRNNRVGQSIFFMLPLLGLVTVGALVMGLSEGWDMTTSLYWAVVTLTTVGYGDYFPSRGNAFSEWFTIFYLPFAVFFLSFFVSRIATVHMIIHTRNIARIENKLRARIGKRGKRESWVEMRDCSGHFIVDADECATLNGDGDVQLDELPISPRSRRERVINLNLVRPEVFTEASAIPNTRTNMSMKEVIESIKSERVTAYNYDVDIARDEGEQSNSFQSRSILVSGRASLNSDKEISVGAAVATKPSFALRVFVQERMSHIIANDIAGHQDSVDIKENTLSITISNLKNTCEKWFVPRRARKAFRAVAFEALFFIGEHGLITKGADALFDLSPVEFNALFAPLIAAMGSARTIETWLATTNLKAEVEHKRYLQSVREEEDRVHETELELDEDQVSLDSRNSHVSSSLNRIC